METIKNPREDLESRKFTLREIGLIISLLLFFFAFNLKINKPSNGTHDYQKNIGEI